MLTLSNGSRSLKYKWYRAEGKLIRPWLRSTIDFGFWIGAKDFKRRRYNFVLETLEEDAGPPGN